MSAEEISRGGRNAFFACLLAGIAAGAVIAILPARAPVRAAASATPSDDSAPLAARIDEARHGDGEPAPWMQVARRASLGLAETVPSLEELRALEAMPESTRLDAWTRALLSDPRTHERLAEQLARALVGTGDGSFVRFRRRRFVAWLTGELARNAPYDAVVREAIAARGVWTDAPAASFVTQAAPDDEPGGVLPDVLTARMARAVLGKRIDCAQCHDHPTAAWTRRDFQGLSSFFASARVTGRGVRDVGAAPATTRVPFAPELLPADGAPRERLAAWATRTRAFARATSNRVWSWMLGAPIVAPVDDIGDDAPPELDLLADDLAAHGFDLRRLVRVIARTRAFRGDAFPVTRLRAEQVAESLVQSGSLVPRARRGALARLVDAVRVRDLAQRFGDPGDEGPSDDQGTVAQRLLVLNLDEDVSREAAAQIADAAGDRVAVEAAFLAVLTRYPSADEARRFEARLAGARGAERRRRVEDLLAALRSTTEAAWNH